MTNPHDEARDALANIVAINGVTKGPWKALNIPLKNTKFHRSVGPVILKRHATDADGLHIAACDPTTMKAIADLMAAQDAQIAAMLDVLKDCESYFSERADAEYFPSGPVANDEMRLMVEVKDAIRAMKGEGE